ncbi:hypothetical protein [uncultured Bilophila sp.]|uniref:hypothetical protein n=1 Tax=uncultured Bilophila sp. TaxID=529385 RepID=UPI00280B5C85|nr:hypothetical protein [uncultured Bilophila sp.]
MAAHQITINPLSGGIGTAPAGVVPYASDMWGVNAVRVPQVGTPSARTQAKAITVGAVRHAATGGVSISFTSRLSPPAIVQAPQWGTATLSFSFTVEADSCPSRSAFGTAALTTLRDVGIPSVAQLPALAGEPAIVSIATVTPDGYTRDTALGLPSLKLAADVSAHALPHQTSWGNPLVSFGWDVASEGILTTRGVGVPGFSNHVDVHPMETARQAVVASVLFETTARIETLGPEEWTLLGAPGVQSLVEALPSGISSQVAANAGIRVESTALALPGGILAAYAVPPLFEVRTETYLITPIAGVANIHEELCGIAVYTATATPVQGIIIPTTRIEGILNIIIPIAGTTRSIL